MSIVSTKIKNILVSGGGGDIGLSLGKILKSEGFQGVFGADISNDNAGECVFEKFFIVPRADDPHYLPTLKKIFIKENIQLFIPSSEAEIFALVKAGLDNNHLYNIPVIMIDSNTIHIALDKYATVRHLEKNNISAPWTDLADTCFPRAYPCIFKPRSGQGSKGIQLIENNEQIKEINHLNGYIWQELLQPNNEEYTCGVFRTREECRTIIFKRTLLGGLTGKGELIYDENINNYIEQIANSLDLIGSANFQLRLTANGPKLFEINPRFSSTVNFRHLLGFQDVIWSIENVLGLPISPYVAPKADIKFYRGYCEYIK